MNAKKILITLLAVVLLIGGTIGGTLAYLAAQTDEVVNTFTVGKIEIDLDETPLVGGKWVGKVVPGGEQEKKPVVTVKAGSESCYVYVCVTVENNIKVTVNGAQVDAVTTDLNTTDWEEVGTSGNKTVYRYKEIVNAASADVAKTVFNKVSYSSEITETNIGTLANLKITVDAYAHQSEHTTQSVADAAAKTHFGIS